MRGIVACLAAVSMLIGIGVAFVGKSSAGDRHRERMHKLVAAVDGYAKAPEYYQGLVDCNHDECFDKHYHVEPGRGRRVNAWFDEYGYQTSMFKAMIRQASDDRAPHVARALQKFLDAGLRNPLPDPEDPKKRR